MFDKTSPNYVVLEFDEPVTPEILDAVEKAVVAPHEIPELMIAHAAYDDGVGKLMRTEPKPISSAA